MPAHSGFDNGTRPSDQKVVYARRRIGTGKAAAITLEVAPEPQRVPAVGRLEAETVFGPCSRRDLVLRRGSRAVSSKLLQALENPDFLVQLI
jgi:hypothetical protein